MLFHATYAAVTIFEFCSTKNLRFVCNKRIVHIYNCVHKILIAVITSWYFWQHTFNIRKCVCFWYILIFWRLLLLYVAVVYIYIKISDPLQALYLRTSWKLLIIHLCFFFCCNSCMDVLMLKYYCNLKLILKIDENWE